MVSGVALVSRSAGITPTPQADAGATPLAPKHVGLQLTYLLPDSLSVDDTTGVVSALLIRMPAELAFLLTGTAVVLAGARLARNGDRIADRTGLGADG